MKTKNILLIGLCATFTVSTINADLYERWVSAKNYFNWIYFPKPSFILSVKKPQVTKKQMVIGGIGVLAIATGFWWWHDKVKAKKNAEIKRKKNELKKPTIDIKSKKQEALILQSEIFHKNATINNINKVEIELKREGELGAKQKKVEDQLSEIKVEKKKLKNEIAIERENKVNISDVQKKFEHQQKTVDQKKQEQELLGMFRMMLDSYEKAEKKESSKADLTQKYDSLAKQSFTIQGNKILFKTLERRYKAAISDLLGD